MVLQVVPDAPGFAHAARRDDDLRLRVVVEGLRFLGRLREAEVGEFERMIPACDIAQGLLVEHGGVRVKDLRRRTRHRAVHIDVNILELLVELRVVVVQFIEFKEDLLRPADRESRNHDGPPAVHGLQHDVHEPADRQRVRRMEAVTVGALHDDIIRLADHRRVAEDRTTLHADIPGEDDLGLVLPLPDPQLDHRRTEDVPGIVEADPHLIVDVDQLIVEDRRDVLERPLRVVQRIERLDFRLALALGFLGRPLRFLLVDVRAVAQHDRKEIRSSFCAINITGKPTFDEQRNAPTVVDMRVAQDQALHFRRFERERLVIERVLRFAPLELPAVQQDLTLLRHHQMARSRNTGRRAAKPDLHPSHSSPCR